MSSTARPGPRLVAGRYLLLDQVGAGGMGSVWRARDVRTGELVAAKVLGQHSGALLARFLREQAIRLRHPHVVAPTGWAAEGDVVLLTMELVTGGSVADLLAEQGPLPDGLVAVVLEQTLLALDAVHAAGIVHRDVKPANLLLEPQDDGRLHVRLADFGIAVTLAGERLTTSPAAVGTPGYMAPDQAAGAPPDPRQDLYAVGMLGLHLLTARRPVPGEPLPSTRLRPLLESLLAAAPEHRPPDARGALLLLRRLDVPPAPAPDVRPRLGPAPDARPGAGLRALTGVGPLALALVPLAVLGISFAVTLGSFVLLARLLGVWE
ncbi:serine/threonine-protein kinase [Nocardioides solisilvae]|uniref:serine/threonine-protein kinase n=1 Tax=Nocardioides solisilvae TaxID=1542435 RepID=UPI0013A583E6|nr:serine/threonine-protein kinase [Nocardioides solisilvae]